MLIPIHVNLLDSSSPGYRKLPPQLVQFGTDELFLVELQGALEVEGNQDGQLIGKLRVDETSVSLSVTVCASRLTEQVVHG